jgi:hypothetical protein
VNAQNVMRKPRLLRKDDKLKKGKRKKSTAKDILLALDIMICVLIGLAIYSLFFRKVIFNTIQQILFINSNTILLSPSLGLWFFLEFIISMLLISAWLIYLSFDLINKYTRLGGYQTIDRTPGSTRKMFKYWFIGSLLFILISLFSYCRVDGDGIHVRELRTLFIEEHYSWDQVKDVTIESYKTSKSHVFNYVVEFGRFRVNLREARFYYSDDTDNRLLFVSKILKNKKIPIAKDIKYKDNQVMRFLEELE